MSPPLVQSYLFFSGRCEEAPAFYQSVLGAEIKMVRCFDESPAPPPPGMLYPGFGKKVMHASFRIGSTQIMASDGCGPGGAFSGFSLSLAVGTVAGADQYFPAPRETVFHAFSDPPQPVHWWGPQGFTTDGVFKTIVKS